MCLLSSLLQLLYLLEDSFKGCTVWVRGLRMKVARGMPHRALMLWVAPDTAATGPM